MRMSFKEFLKLDKETQKALGNMSEELSPELKKKKSIELEKLLHHQQEVDDKVKKLQSEIGDDALTLTKIYVESKTSPTPVKDEVKERQSIFPEQNVSQKNISLGYGDVYVL